MLHARRSHARARAQEGTTKIDPKVLKRFEKKLRLTEGAITPSGGATTREGLVAVLARAEEGAGKRVRTPEQTRALSELRAELERRESEVKEGTVKVRALAESLAADTARLVALATPKPKPPAKARVAAAKRPKTPKKKAAAS